ncbi:MAG: NAD(P)H-hydrate dehydratase [Planctomycetia bacterium]|jgi:NAD(P)H-hydrate epimerase
MTEPIEKLPSLPARNEDDHKGTFGTVLIVGGSRGMFGAPALAAIAALRGGAGLVRVAVPDVCLETVASFHPAYTTVPLPCDGAGRIGKTSLKLIIQQAEQATVVALGPGLGQSEAIQGVVGELWQSLSQPMVVDADGLNALGLDETLHANHAGPRIITPHPGEFARLLGGKKLEDLEQRNEAAVKMAKQAGITVVLKGHRTCVTDGDRTWLNTTGNPGMATGGSGDVLTGLMAALWAQFLDTPPFDPWQVARVAVNLHGRAGDLSASQLGQIPVTATDLIEAIPAAFYEYDAGL